MKNELLLRIGDEDDIDAIVELLNTCYRGREGWTTEADIFAGERVSADAVQEMLADRRRYFFVFDNNGRDGMFGSLLGCIVVWLDTAAAERRDGERTAYVEMAAVHPAVQNQGLGAEMLHAVEEFAARHLRQGWIKMSIVQSRAELIAYYERRGYSRTGLTSPLPQDNSYRHPITEGLQMIELQKSLNI